MSDAKIVEGVSEKLVAIGNAYAIPSQVQAMAVEHDANTGDWNVILYVNGARIRAIWFKECQTACAKMTEFQQTINGYSK